MNWQTYFSFSRSQTRAVVFLLFANVICWLVYFLMPYWVSAKVVPASHDLVTQKANLEASLKAKNANNNFDSKESEISKLTPFLFDPNTIDAQGLKKLGLREKLIATILNYRSKGGKFYNKESLKRIYGLHPEEFVQLEPYIQIVGYESAARQSKKEIIEVDLNLADTAQLVKINGIGSKTALNIIKYREQLGGFVNVIQLQEVFGISPENYERIRPSCKINTSKIRKLNLSEATYNELNAHPYLKGEIAKAIADLRKTKGYQIKNLNELKEIPLITEEIFRKIAPYLRIQ